MAGHAHRWLGLVCLRMKYTYHDEAWLNTFKSSVIMPQPFSNGLLDVEPDGKCFDFFFCQYLGRGKEKKRKRYASLSLRLRVP